MSALRKKRNFKALQLDVSKQPNPETQRTITNPSVIPALRNTAGGKKRPPPMTLKASKPAVVSEEDGINISAADGPTSAQPIASASANRMTYHTTLSNTLANLDMNAEDKYQDLRHEDLKDIKELGQGNGGSVKKVEHVPTGTIMAKKVRIILFYITIIDLWLIVPDTGCADCPDRCEALSTKTNLT
jgi:mitogen-activated protein kinase kinase